MGTIHPYLQQSAEGMGSLMGMVVGEDPCCVEEEPETFVNDLLAYLPDDMKYVDQDSKTSEHDQGGWEVDSENLKDKSLREEPESFKDNQTSLQGKQDTSGEDPWEDIEDGTRNFDVRKKASRDKRT